MTAAQIPPQPQTIRLETQNYIVRTAEPTDATEAWCRWLLDPTAVRQLNARPTAMTMEQLTAYIKRFDRVTGHLLGIFEKVSGRIVGIRSIYVDHKTREFVDNALIGEPDARERLALRESTDALQPFFFEDLDLLAARCAILTSNARMIEFILRQRWELAHVEQCAANNGGLPIELRHFRLTRDRWRERERTRAEAQRNA
ncbi:MAG: hypothetical protein KBA31_09375 [Alphaproteobacteria bacterium]|nr:hypothetical protein [Alphaproteobacteria bacterium]